MKTYAVELLCTIFFALTVAKSIGIEHCPPGWRKWSQSCYMITPTPMLWEHVRQLCRRLGGRMAVPSSQGENQFIAQLASEFQSDLWIDCTDKEKEGVWVCSEDDDPGGGYRNWYHNQPNNWPESGDGAGADFAAMWPDYDVWRDFGDRHYYSLCEKRQDCAASISCRAVWGSGSAPQTRCLLGHSIKETAVTHAMQCCIACYKETDCRSFNFILPGRVCQLNNATREQVDPEFFVQVKNCTYYN